MEVRRFERMKRCPFCAEDILAAAIKCKHCGSSLSEAAIETAAQPQQKNIFKRPVGGKEIFSLFIAIIGGCWLVGAFNTRDPAVGPLPTSKATPDESPPPIGAPAQNLPDRSTAEDMPSPPAETHRIPKPTHVAAPERPTYQTTAEQLYQDYKANEVAADEKIGNAKVEVTGTIRAINKDFTDSVVLELQISGFADAPMSLPDSEKSAAANLVQGQQVTVICDHVRRIMTVPSGSDCKLAQY
jgi:hypothetical protein